MIRKFAVLLCCYTAIVAAYEEIPPIHISKIIPSELAQSVSHRVEDARLTGDYIQFKIESDEKVINVDSIPLLITRVREISILNQAVYQLNREHGKTAEYSRGKYQVSADSALDIITRPGSIASNVAGQVRKNLENTESNYPVENYRDTETDTVESEDPVIAMHKRNIANQWGLDVYSSNTDVQAFLNDASMARAAGRISAGSPPIFNRDIMPLKLANHNLENELRSVLKNYTRSELQELNNRLLSGMNINARIRRLFLYNNIFSPKHKTVISHYLKLIDEVTDRSAFMDLAIKADTEISALGYETACRMLAYYHENINPLSKLFSGNGILQAITRSNRMVYFSTADLIYWTSDSEELFESLTKQAKSAGIAERELITTGEITDEASGWLIEKGFMLRKGFIF